MISEKNPKIGAVRNSARLGPGGHVLAGDGASVIRRNAFSPDKGLSRCRYADCGPSRLRKTAHEQATSAFTTTEETTATDLLQLIFC